MMTLRELLTPRPRDEQIHPDYKLTWGDMHAVLDELFSTHQPTTLMMSMAMMDRIRKQRAAWHKRRVIQAKNDRRRRHQNRG